MITVCSVCNSSASEGLFALHSLGWRKTPLGSALQIRAEGTVTVSLYLLVFWRADCVWHFLSCGTMCLDFIGIGPLLSMKAGFLFPARRAGSLIHHIFWVCWIQLKYASAESVSREKAGLDKGQLKTQFVSDSYWHVGPGEDRDEAKAHSPHKPDYADK